MADSSSNPSRAVGEPMADAPFDPSGAVTFDLSVGRVNLEHAPTRVLAPAEGLIQLCQAAGEDATQAFGRAIGTSMGDRLAKRMTEEGMKNISMDRYVEHLQGEFALAGLGIVSIERWGDALLFVVDHPALTPQLVAAVLDGALEASTGRKTACVKLMISDTRTRLLVASQGTSKKVAGWIDDGMSWGEALVKLHAGGNATQPRGEA